MAINALNQLTTRRLRILWIVMGALLLVSIMPLWLYHRQVLRLSEEKLQDTERLQQNEITRSLASETVQGTVLERGPDSFLTEKPAASTANYLRDALTRDQAVHDHDERNNEQHVNEPAADVYNEEAQRPQDDEVAPDAEAVWSASAR